MRREVTSADSFPLKQTKSEKMKSIQKLILKRWRPSGQDTQARVLPPSSPFTRGLPPDGLFLFRISFWTDFIFSLFASRTRGDGTHGSDQDSQSFRRFTIQKKSPSEEWLVVVEYRKTYRDEETLVLVGIKCDERQVTEQERGFAAKIGRASCRERV